MSRVIPELHVSVIVAVTRWWWAGSFSRSVVLSYTALSNCSCPNFSGNLIIGKGDGI